MGSSLLVNKAINQPNASGDKKRGIRRENEPADILADNGYIVEQNPTGLAQTTKPDFRIEGRLFDCYSPTSSNPRHIVNEINDKATRQSPRIVLNLADTDVSRHELRAAIDNYLSTSVVEIIVIDQSGFVVRFYP